MTLSIQPIEYCHRTDIQAYAIGNANVKVYGDYTAMYTQDFGRLDWPPDIMTFMFTNNLSTAFEIHIYGHFYLALPRVWINF
jgi:hypothetical protein